MTGSPGDRSSDQIIESPRSAIRAPIVLRDPPRQLRIFEAPYLRIVADDASPIDCSKVRCQCIDIVSTH